MSETAHLDIQLNLFKLFAIVPLLYFNWFFNRSVICMTLSCENKVILNCLISKDLTRSNFLTSIAFPYLIFLLVLQPGPNLEILE